MFFVFSVVSSQIFASSLRVVIQGTFGYCSQILATRLLAFERMLLTVRIGLSRGAMGMAAIGVALWKYVMQYSPENPNYFNRDRFVLSNGELSKTSLKIIGRIKKTKTSIFRTLLFVAVHFYALGWLREHDIGPTQIVSLSAYGFNMPRTPRDRTGGHRSHNGSPRPGHRERSGLGYGQQAPGSHL